MRGVTYKHILSGGWDNVKVIDQNGGEVKYGGAMCSFDSDIYLRGDEGQEEILISLNDSPITITGAANNGFPYQVKGTGFLNILTIN